MTIPAENEFALPFEDYIGKHEGKKFLVCGTGMSIDQYPVEFYNEWDGLTIGVNDIVEKFVPDYHIDIHERPGVINCVGDVDLIYKYRNPSTGIDAEKTGRLSMYGTVAVTAMTAAYQMGASEIYLIGIDLKATLGRHHFKGCTSIFEDGLKSHVIQAEDELKATVRTFYRAYNAYREQGVKVINLSDDSLLEANNEITIPCG